MAHLGLIRHTKNIYLENRAHQRAQEGEKTVTLDHIFFFNEIG